MLINSLHGYFIFKEEGPGDISDFRRMTGFDLELEKDYFVFSFLKDAPKFSILGIPYLGVPAIKTFEGEPWDVMRANKLVYNFNLGLVQPILSVIQIVKISQAINYYLSNGMILPGSITDDGTRVTDYSAFFDFSSAKFRYGEITLESI